MIKRFPKLPEWEGGDKAPTLKQLEAYANATHTPVGFFFLSEPPAETMPIPDYRTFGDGVVHAPSPDLLDTIYACEQRQDWYREFADERGYEPVEIVGSQSERDDPVVAAAALREALGFGLARRVEFPNWTKALDGLRDHAEAAGVLVMINGVVGNNTHRKLRSEEFRGFALVDRVAPVVFVNASDTKAAQIFTLAHELAHVSLGGSAVSRPDLGHLDDELEVERWCNDVAAELLVPRDSVLEEFDASNDLTEELERLAKFYKASTLVVLRRLRDVGSMTAVNFRAAYPIEFARILGLAVDRAGGGGGDFLNTEPVRVSRTFARALLTDTAEGRTMHKDAFRLLGFKKYATFEKLGERLGVA